MAYVRNQWRAVPPPHLVLPSRWICFDLCAVTDVSMYLTSRDSSIGWLVGTLFLLPLFNPVSLSTIDFCGLTLNYYCNIATRCRIISCVFNMLFTFPETFPLMAWTFWKKRKWGKGSLIVQSDAEFPAKGSTCWPYTLLHKLLLVLLVAFFVCLFLVFFNFACSLPNQGENSPTVQKRIK